MLFDGSGNTFKKLNYIGFFWAPCNAINASNRTYVKRKSRLLLFSHKVSLVLFQRTKIFKE